MNRVVQLVLAGVAGAVVSLPLGVHLGGGGRLLYTTPSPDGSERVEFHAPPRWRAWLAPAADLAATVRLVRVGDAEPLSEDSPVIELSGAGPALWTAGSVQVGTTAVFDRRSGRWRTEP